ncbi:MAG: hypothetical protein WCH21_05585 [Bacteroidota bacterium]
MSSVQVKAIQTLFKGVPGVKPAFSPNNKKKFKLSEPIKKSVAKPTKKEKTKNPTVSKSPAKKNIAAKSKQFKELTYAPKTPPVDLRGFENQ